ncbi:MULTISPECIES: DUF397 domain-containing protein [unclassified Streptomyces]|uniref:DUF397 domain-containing protein n=1 Tax=unclassified Streptomyces TaxID=2593676 RepID=UPI001F039DC0|nr:MULTISPECIES: DUF397 domain-containing protein [unclassified Streptomyces]MCH0561775.1 DUF397 domain-containing protein [Streptomyces sp. MUM 2J]MCH0571615.1 DUF397 domain-containing protein [Streptomyces sp. MUM 136J]
MNIDVDEVVAWRTSSYSSGEGGQCVEVAVLPHVVCVRDSKGVDQPFIPVGPAAWAAFVGFAAR